MTAPRKERSPSLGPVQLRRWKIVLRAPGGRHLAQLEIDASNSIAALVGAAAQGALSAAGGDLDVEVRQLDEDPFSRPHTAMELSRFVPGQWRDEAPGRRVKLGFTTCSKAARQGPGKRKDAQQAAREAHAA